MPFCNLYNKNLIEKVTVPADEVWVMHIANDYEWATLYTKITKTFTPADIEPEGDYETHKTRWLHAGEHMPDVGTLYGVYAVE